MKSILYSKARNNLRSIKETLYLFSSKNNRDRLLDSIEQIENAKFFTKDLDL